MIGLLIVIGSRRVLIVPIVIIVNIVSSRPLARSTRIAIALLLTLLMMVSHRIIRVLGMISRPLARSILGTRIVLRMVLRYYGTVIDVFYRENTFGLIVS